MAILKSNSFKGDAALEACATQDAAHIVPGAKGLHVGKIQRALNIVDYEGIGSADINAMTYGIETSNAVTKFKTKRNILNYAGRIDPIVGIKTIRALDQEMLAIDLEKENVIDATKYTDVIIRFVGGQDGDGPGTSLNGIVKPPEYASFNRELHGYNWGANVGQPDIKVLLAFHHIVRLSKMASIGVLCIRGSSRGGRWALRLAESLTIARVPISFVSLQDAAFSTTDAINSPSGWRDSDIDNVPLFPGSDLLKADCLKLNHFQAMGNGAERSISQNKLIWKSYMKTSPGEIHGEVRGFLSRRWTIRGLDKSYFDFADNAHARCCGFAEAEDLRIISGLLNTACGN
jgi:hypothetical protein